MNTKINHCGSADLQFQCFCVFKHHQDDDNLPLSYPSHPPAIPKCPPHPHQPGQHPGCSITPGTSAGIIQVHQVPSRQNKSSVCIKLFLYILIATMPKQQNNYTTLHQDCLCYEISSRSTLIIFVTHIYYLYCWLH